MKARGSGLKVGTDPGAWPRTARCRRVVESLIAH